MESQGFGIPWPRMLILVAALAVSVLALGWILLQGPTATVEAGNDDGVDDPTVLDDQGRFTGPGEVWPPEPKNVTAVVERNFGDLEAEPQAQRLDRIDEGRPAAEAPSAVVAADPQIQAALGEAHNLIAVEEMDGITNMVFYSLSANQTVDVTVVDGQIESLDLYSPGEFQPELSSEEKQAAIDVARAHWQAKGDSRIDSLQGFSILAFQPGGAYYDTRMVYVSFHVDEDARPELLAWVNLVTGDVEKSEVDR